MTLRFAVVGCGAAATRIHLPLLRAEGHVVSAFASRSRSSAEAARAAWGGGAVVDEWVDAVARDDVDAVVVATPNALHAPVALAAIAVGKHVLVDKPLATTAADAERMAAAADAAGVVLVPFHNSRFAPPFVAARDAVAAGVIGDVTGFRAAFGHGGPHGWAPDATWFYDRQVAGGGCLIDLGVHIVDVVRAVTGHDVVEVAAATDGTADTVESDAHVLARLDSGALGTIHASWVATCGLDHQLTVVGSTGTLHLDTRSALTLLRPDGSRERVVLPDVVSNPLAELAAAVAGERPPAVTAADGHAAVAVVEAAYRSAASGTRATPVL